MFTKEISRKPHCAIYPFLRADEVTHISVLHIWKNHQGEPFFGQHDAQQRQNVRVVETFHDDALSEELVHLPQICDPCSYNTDGGSD